MDGHRGNGTSVSAENYSRETNLDSVVQSVRVGHRALL